MTHLIHKGLDDEKQIAMVFLDISKAFDKVWHDGLLFKLDSNGVKGKLLKLIKSYLGDRKQRVVLNGSVSEFLNILSGVPQGSILGPLFFLVFLNDIIDNIKCHISLFADDTSLLSIAKSWMAVEAELNLALTKVNIWAQKWLVTFNATKTVYMTFSNSSGRNDLNLALNNVKIEKVNCYKHLGIILNDRLSWTDHIEFVCKKQAKSWAI